MKKILLVLTLGLAACTPLIDQIIPPSPAPLARTTIDDKTLILALETFDTVLTSVDRLVAAKVIVPGSPRALQIAKAIHNAKLSYQAASAAQRAGNSTSYTTALLQARVAIAQINSLVKGN